MAAGKYNMLIQQGVSYNQTITLKDSITGTPVDISGCSAAAMIRGNYNDVEPAAIFTTFIGSGTDGAIQISLTPSQTSNIAIERGLYDIELTYPNGTKDRILQGNVVISKEVTK